MGGPQGMLSELSTTSQQQQLFFGDEENFEELANFLIFLARTISGGDPPETTNPALPGSPP
jgi:hypothetical protein